MEIFRGLGKIIGKELGRLPPEVTQWMNDKTAQILDAGPNDPVWKYAFEELQLLQRRQDQYGKDPLYDFLNLYHIFVPESLALLEVDSVMKLDIIWKGAWTVPQLGEKIARGEISPQTLRPAGGETPKQRFRKLQEEVVIWHRTNELEPTYMDWIKSRNPAALLNV